MYWTNRGWQSAPSTPHPDASRVIARLIVEGERTPGADADDDFDLLPTDSMARRRDLSPP